MHALFILTLFGGTTLLAMSVWPGVVADVVFAIPFVLLTLPFLAFWTLLLVALALRDLCRRRDPARRAGRYGLLSAGLLVGTLGLLLASVPQRAAFALCASAWTSLAEERLRGGATGEGGKARVGPYLIDRSRVDRRGGVFYRTHTGPGIGPDQMSYGFAFRPNGQGTPFGNAGYRLRHLTGEWYVFQASDDW
jgi:hypothetical protein